MKYWITKHIQGMDIPMFRINYSSQYHTGSHPITNIQDAIDFIVDEFGKGELTYAMQCFRTEIAEMLLKACQEMEADKVWKDEGITIREFFKAFK
tara:strand:- start:2439 stop:2723 length:285 start_codon:yes stop_codon:yes gene_type:complete